MKMVILLKMKHLIKIFKNLKNCNWISIVHELYIIFETISFSFIKNELEKIKHFIPFSIDNNGGISLLFYCAMKKVTLIYNWLRLYKSFNKMRTEGIFRYIQNIIGCIGRSEVYEKYFDKVDLT